MEKEIFLIISPHLDDAALSCGGLIKRLTGSGNPVTVATVYTSDAPKDLPISWLAHRNHEAWGVGAFPFESRKIEDVKAMRILGADYIHLDLLDAMYRRGQSGNCYYLKNTVGVPVAVPDEENNLGLLSVKYQEIQNQFAGQTLRIICPIALGGHVDHIIVRRAVEAFWNQNEILYYEDYPYNARLDIK